MRISTLLLAAMLALASCARDAATQSDADPVLLRARAMQALVCVQLQRSPPTWKSDFGLSGPGGPDETWQTLSEQPLLDHGHKISSVYRKTTNQLYLVIQGGFPETWAVYGPLPRAPECGPSLTTAAASAA